MFDLVQTADRFYTMVKSLGEFDKLEVRGVIETLLSTTVRERCFIATYQAGEIKAHHKIPYVDCIAAALAILTRLSW